MNKTQMKQVILVAAIIALPSLCFASEAPNVDTLKVIDNPKQVVVSQTDEALMLHVDGCKSNEDYNYECRVTPKHHSLIVMEREGKDLEFRCPFMRRDTTDKKYHFQLFMSDIYFGFGGSSVGADNSGAIKQAFPQVGILNLLGLGYEFNKERSRVSLGVGFNWSWYTLHEPYYWSRTDDGVVGYVTDHTDYKGHNATLRVVSMQFPLIFNQSLGKRWSLAAGPILNWNYYAVYNNKYSLGDSDYSVTTRGLHQRKLSFDYIAMVSWHGLGAYFRYAPQSVFESGFGPEIKNRWTIGFILRGL